MLTLEGERAGSTASTPPVRRARSSWVLGFATIITSVAVTGLSFAGSRTTTVDGSGRTGRESFRETIPFARRTFPLTCSPRSRSKHRQGNRPKVLRTSTADFDFIKTKITSTTDEETTERVFCFRISGSPNRCLTFRAAYFTPLHSHVDSVHTVVSSFRSSEVYTVINLRHL